ncbi:IQ domain-containing protein C [Taeniopygia guttata]|uniref:IQ domain-containing protein C n=1 Tax=Taeniopygia guttata TaxID=59729 RepID=UPI003BB9648E
MTSAGGGAAMAAEAGPEAERRRLIRAVTGLQARARGFLLRRQLRAAREEFEALVLQLEGDRGQLSWSGRVLPRPRFGIEEPIPGKTGEEEGTEWGHAPPPAPPDPPNLGEEEEEEGAGSGDTESSESPGILQELQALPRRELQQQRLQLQLELLWIQQAMASRKHFLLLKQKLGIPHHACSSIPEFLHCWGEALELQQLQQQQP